MVKLTILYDNLAEEGFHGAWGFSCLIETGEKTILFDTGWDGLLLLDNMSKLGISAMDIDTLVLSHQHWDHIGGVATFLNANPDVDIYVPFSFSPRLKQEMSNLISANLLHEVKGSQEVCSGVHSTGELGDDIKEQSLLIDSDKGVCVICGCAHPGLAAILDRALDLGEPVAIIGGLHGSEEYGLLSSLHLIGAGHCTVHKDKIRALYPETFADISVGYTLEL
ncbi:MBL fold metallo-hydrolase [Methanolobus sp. ZRKC3]|uniref:MBL fold metallo-hydrolase n=1 Tax=Methanolobus sp. ZRKC3 TaxID=3125786 RepID=UPI0032458E9C